MKKIIVVAAIVCATVMSHAAAVSWMATASSTYNEQNLYLLTSISKNYTSLAAFVDTAVDVGTVTRTGPSYKIALHEANHENITSSSDFYLAVVDVKTIHYLDVTGKFKSMVYAPPESSPGDVSVNFADVANSTTTATIGDPTPTPEPTSGILLLFGMAGLALRRRRV